MNNLSNMINKYLTHLCIIGLASVVTATGIYFATLNSHHAQVNNNLVTKSNVALNHNKVGRNKGKTEQNMAATYNGIPQEALITTINKDWKNTIWVGTQKKGLYEKPNGSSSFTNFSLVSAKTKKLPNPPTWISIIFQDRQNNLWIAANYSGLFERAAGKSSFTLQSTTNKYSRGFQNKFLAITEDYRGNLFVGTWVGLFQLVAGDGPLFVKNVQPILSETAINVITEDSHDNLWVGTLSNGLWNKINGSNDFKHQVINDGTPTTIRINAIVFDSENNLWIGCWNSIWEKQDNSPKYQKIVGININSMDKTVICQDTQNNMWVGTQHNGAYEKPFGAQKFRQNTQLPHPNTSSKFGDLKSQINVIIEDNHSNLWCGTKNQGLWEKPNNNFSFQRDSSIPKDACVSVIFKDKQGNLFFSGGVNGGISEKKAPIKLNILKTTIFSTGIIIAITISIIAFVVFVLIILRYRHRSKMSNLKLNSSSLKINYSPQKSTKLPYKKGKRLSSRK